MSHSVPMIDALGRVAAGHGGAKLAIAGPRTRQGLYRVGVRFPPVATLFEAVLRPLLASRRYAQIVAFTGHSIDRLPSRWKVSGGLSLGDDATIWAVTPIPSASAAPVEAPSNPWEIPTHQLSTSRRSEQLLWRSANQTYWARLEKYLEVRDNEIEKARRNGARAALLLDYAYLTPFGDDWDLFSGRKELGLPYALSYKISRSMEVNREYLQPVDLILFSEGGVPQSLVSAAGSVLPELCETALGDRWRANASKLEPMMPRLSLGAGVDLVDAEREMSAGGRTLELDEPSEAATMYAVLRKARLSTRASQPRPPRYSDRVDLEFWADLDLDPLREAFDREVIGQVTIKSSILRVLQNYRERCRRILANNAKAIKTVNDRESLLPIIGLFGAAGMGKTTFCRILARYLFGADEFGRIVDLSSKILATETIGVSPPYQGSDQESGLMQFARDTRGLGVFCFDEFTRVQRHQESLAEALSPLLELVETRTFVPANRALRPTGERYYMTNTLFIFSANLARPGEPTPTGFSSVDDLGEPLKRRLFGRAEIFYFDSLRREHFRPALEQALKRYASVYGNEMYPDRAAIVRNAEVDPRLLDLLVDDVNRRLSASGGEPSLGIVDAAVSNLSYEKAFDLAAANHWQRFVLDTQIAGGAG